MERRHMTIKKFAFEVQSSLSKAHGIDVKRSHIHEVLAALFGYASYASLTHQSLLAQLDDRPLSHRLDIAGAAARALDLGYATPTPPIIAAVAAIAADGDRLCVVTVDDVMATLGIEIDAHEQIALADQNSEPHDFNADDGSEVRHEDALPSIDLESPFLRESLLRLIDSGRGISAHLALAHLALAHLEDMFLEDEPIGALDGRYWVEQQQAGRMLSGIELDWADTYRRRQAAIASREHHLQRAAALGSAEAALRRAEENSTDENFEAAARLAGDRHAVRLGNLAMSCGREDDARKWLRAAAQRGDITAMKTLACQLEYDLREAWTWVHLAELMGVNLMAYHAVGDDGLPVDADEAGPIYAAGGFELDELSSADDEAAKGRARALYEAIAN
jgi:hypothetical protein